MDRNAISDALIDLDRLTARVARREGVTIAISDGVPLLSESLKEIHSRIAEACGLGD